MNKPWYKSAYRRMLVDMHIPDWDDAFLSKYDPKRMADLYGRAKVSAVMFYCQSHVGLCYWPTRTGKMHAGLHGRDIVGDLLAELKRHAIPTVAYYSVIHNNWAMLEHPDWAVVLTPEDPASDYAESRYGLCCPNHPGYRAFALAQTEELVRGYDFEGFFFDMTFWPKVCLCRHCQNLFHAKTGREVPRVVNWHDPDWCAFHAAREQWIMDFARDLTGAVEAIKPGMTVYHNSTPPFLNWLAGCPLGFTIHNDYLGGDFYGDSLQQLLICKVMTNLTQNRPAEFMTSRCIDLRDHVRLKSFDQMQMQALAALLFSSAFLFIDAIDPVGTADADVYERIGEIYGFSAQYEPYLGGEPVEDIAIYFSNESKMDFLENGRAVSRDIEWAWTYPHLEAAQGAARLLQRAHLPFGAITRKQLHALDRYKLVILPNVLRMDDEEAEAFRGYVQRGGRLYASGYSSLVHTSGKPLPQALLADVFGCTPSAEPAGTMWYIKPRHRLVIEGIAPQKYLSVIPRQVPSRVVRVDPRESSPRVRGKVTGDVWATLSLPYGSPNPGTMRDTHWSSIHSSPPWEDTEEPSIMRNQFGKGSALYATAAIESVESEANDKLFLALLCSLLDEPLSYGAELHPAVWMNVLHQPESDSFIIGMLNYPLLLPPVTIPHGSFHLRPPKDMRFKRLVLLPEATNVPFTTDADGTLRADVRDLDRFQMLKAIVEPI